MSLIEFSSLFHAERGYEDMQREIMQYKEKIAEVEQEASAAKLENEELRKRLAEFEKSR